MFILMSASLTVVAVEEHRCTQSRPKNVSPETKKQAADDEGIRNYS
jgi:hypothetical protein